MRTRRSPKNQDRMFTYLFKPAPASDHKKSEIEIIEGALAKCLSQRTRRQLERDLERAKRRAAIAKAKGGAA